MRAVIFAASRQLARVKGRVHGSTLQVFGDAGRQPIGARQAVNGGDGDVIRDGRRTGRAAIRRAQAIEKILREMQRTIAATRHFTDRRVATVAGLQWFEPARPAARLRKGRI